MLTAFSGDAATCRVSILGRGRKPHSEPILRRTIDAGHKAFELTAPFTLPTPRKSFGQNHADAGKPPPTLAKLLGHSNTRITMQYYNRVTEAN